MTSRWFRIACGAALLLGASDATGQAPTPGGRVPTVTRLVRLFDGLENEAWDAVHQKDRAALERFLADDFEVRRAASPGVPVPRAEWLGDALGSRDLPSFRLTQMAVRELGEVALVSFLLQEEPEAQGQARRGGSFIVDAWIKMDGGWRLKARYTAPARTRPPDERGKPTGSGL
jgi:hypothetical protein